jgi:hypothetical protein
MQEGLGDTEFEFRQWPCSIASEMSSNWRELNNFVELLEWLGREGTLTGWEIFLCSNNSVAEGAHSNGHSSSPALDTLTLRLYILELIYQCILHLLHVSGLHMIEQGGDGLSRGDRGT